MKGAERVHEVEVEGLIDHHATIVADHVIVDVVVIVVGSRDHPTCSHVNVLQGISSLQRIDRHLLTNSTFLSWKDALEGSCSCLTSSQSRVEDRCCECKRIAWKNRSR